MKNLIDFLKQIRANRRHGARWADIRFYFSYRKYNQKGISSIKEELPWLSFRAVEFLKKNIHPDMIAFEYGGGGSTAFFNGRVKKLVTVEHDEKWFAWLQDYLKDKLRSEWTPRFIAAAPGDLFVPADASEPLHFASNDEPSKGKNYRDYVNAILDYPENYFDVILIDGRARTSCVAVSFSRLKPGGILVLDNAEREYYLEKNTEIIRQLDVLVSGKGPVLYSPNFSETRIYRKKKQ